MIQIANCVTKTELILVLGQFYSKLLRLIRQIPRCKLDGWIFDTLRFTKALIRPGQVDPHQEWPDIPAGEFICDVISNDWVNDEFKMIKYE